MAVTNRMRCPHCGMCYEGETTASEMQTMTCQICGATTTLQEEDPEGVRSGAFPPLSRLLALGGAILLSLVAVRFSFFAILVFGVLVYLAVEILQAHKKQRAARIALWDRLRETYTELDKSNKGLTTDLAQTKQSLAELSDRYEKIAPERRDRLFLTCFASARSEWQHLILRMRRRRAYDQDIAPKRLLNDLRGLIAEARQMAVCHRLPLHGPSPSA